MSTPPDPDRAADPTAHLPVTVSITRHVAPARVEGMIAWVRAGSSLARWEASPQRSWWLESAQGLVGESRRERRTGIEGWFDPPQHRDVQDLRPEAPAPPRWKQAVMIWTAFFPLSLWAGALLGVATPGLALVPGVLLTTVVMTPVMTYVVLPQLTARLEWWLHGRPAPSRR